MELFEAIQKRCSVRKYESRDVEEDKLRCVLEAGIAAPTARNRQEFKFVVVRDAALRARLGEASEQEWLEAVPIIIAIVGLTPDRVMFCDVPSDPVDCAIAIDHMALAARDLGLGTCWIGAFNQEAVKGILGIPGSVAVVQLLPLGYPTSWPDPRPRKSLDEVVAYDGWE